MKAIFTKYHGPGNVRGARISADDHDGNRIVIAYDHALGGRDSHRKAALALCAKMRWSGKLVEAGDKAGNIYVFVESWNTIEAPASAAVYTAAAS